MPKVWGYVRVSTVEQADKGVSLDAQRAQIADEFERNWKSQGWEFGGIQGDPAGSAKKPFLERPGAAKVVYAAERGDVIMFTRLDRAFRNTRDALATIDMLVTMAIRPVFLDLKLDLGTPIGKFVFTNLAAFAELERSMISQRTKEGLEQYRKKNRPHKPWFGIYLTGQRPNRVVEVQENNYAFGLKLLSWREKGYTYDAIADHLNKSGLRKKLTPKQSQRYKNYKFQRIKCHVYEYTWGMVSRMVLGAVRTTEAIKSGRVKRPSGLPPGVAREFGTKMPQFMSVGIACASEPAESMRPRIVQTEAAE
jgi:DNA invertase Pin-like site-specific DNA recombinase